jgi:hypothetical protein
LILPQVRQLGAAIVADVANPTGYQSAVGKWRLGSCAPFRLYLDVRFAPTTTELRTFKKGRNVPTSDIPFHDLNATSFIRIAKLFRVITFPEVNC